MLIKLLRMSGLMFLSGVMVGFLSCNKNPGNSSGDDMTNPSDVTVTDYDGNVYSTVMIGSQLWLAENWKCTHAQDGSALNGVYAYNDNENNVLEYGRLYFWETALIAAPLGWRLPSDEDWNILISELGNEAGKKIKEGGSSGFNAKLSGYRYYGGGYADIDRWGIYWSSTPVTIDHSNVINVFHDQSNIVHSGLGINGAISVRYVRN